MAAVTAPARKALSRPVIIAIGVSVTVVVVALAAFLVYWFVFHTAGSTHNAGSDKFGAIVITDTRHGPQNTNFAPGDTLQLQYQPTASGFSGRSVWSLSTDGGATYPVALADPTFGNTITWTILPTIFTQQAVFKVSDAQNAADFVDTAQTAITIEPAFTLVSGPSVVTADSILQGVPVQSVLKTDTGLTGLTAQSFQVQLSKDPQFQTGLSLAANVTATLNTNAVTVSWTATALVSDTYYRISTTTLVANGYPYELSATSPHTLTVSANASCSSHTGSGAAFELCELQMAEQADGRNSNFLPGSAVNVFVAFLGTYPGSTTFTYTIDGGSAVPWTLAQVKNEGGVLQFQGTLPDQSTTAFVVTATSGSATVTNAGAYTLVSAFLINSSGTPLFVINPVCNSLNYYETSLTLIPPSFNPPAWQVGWSNLDGTGLQLYPATFLSASQSLQWCLTSADFPHPTGQQSKRLVVSTQSGVVTVQQSIAATFAFAPYSPSFTPLTGVTGTPFEGCSVNNASLFGSQATEALGLWPVGTTPEAGYYVSTLPNASQTNWWGVVTNGATLAECTSLSGAVNYVPCVPVASSSTTPPAGAGIYTLTQGPAGTVQFSSLQPTVSPQVLDVQICADDTCPGTGADCPDSVLLAGAPNAPATAASNFVWPSQRFPWG